MDGVADIIRYRLQRSEETLAEAKLMVQAEHWNAAMSRLYYAAYYAVSALLYQQQVFTKTHSGIKSQFNLLFIKTNKIEPAFGELYTILFL